METTELIEHLRIMGKSDDRNPNYYLLAADRLEDLQESVNTWMATFDMLNDRENRHHYLDYWREKNGESNLTYPDGDQVYKDFFAMMADRDHLLKAGAAMHTWIFLHTGDEEAAYVECGLSCEDNARFGYAGSVMLEVKDHPRQES